MNTQLKKNSEKQVSTTGLTHKFTQLQRNVADYFNLKCRNISSRGLLALLITFSTLISVVLLRLIINAIG